MKNKIFLLVLFVAGILLALSPFALSYERLCLGYGVSLPNNDDPVYTCFHDTCIVCVTDSLFPTNPSRCNQINGCSAFGNASIDQEAPEITINSPLQEGIYTSRTVLFDIELNEPGSIYYLDNLDTRRGWRRVCGGCRDYNRGRRMNEGFNNLTIKASDRKGNSDNITITFFTDTKKPKISKTFPKKGSYIGSEFIVEYTEDNLKEVKLYYGDKSGNSTNELVLGGCEGGKKKQCSIDISLSQYDGMEIAYWFTIEDIAGTITESRHSSVYVDEKDPVINSLEFPIDGRRVEFYINVTEINFDELGYIDWTDSRPRYRRLCTRLKEGICDKRKSFRSGEHNLTIQVLDEAGNMAAKDISFII